MNSLYHNAHFLLSVPNRKSAPADEGIEVAFAGRSNSGKSQTGLARTSKTPGRTQHIVFFELDASRRLVDLPGYGYASAPKALQREWAKALEDYMENRACLRGIVMMMDIRRPFTDLDMGMLEWCEFIRRPVHILLTKADKLKPNPGRQTFRDVCDTVDEFEMDVSVQLFSSLKKIGVKEAHRALDSWFCGETEGVAAEK